MRRCIKVVATLLAVLACSANAADTAAKPPGDTGAKPAGDTGAKPPGGTAAKPANGKLYTVSEGNKVDELTLKGWKTWRAMAWTMGTR